jgi:hypothetical protein
MGDAGSDYTFDERIFKGGGLTLMQTHARGLKDEGKSVPLEWAIMALDSIRQ